MFLPVVGGPPVSVWRSPSTSWPVQAGPAGTVATPAAPLVVFLATGDPMLIGAAVGASVVVAVFAAMVAEVGWGSRSAALTEPQPSR